MIHEAPVCLLCRHYRRTEPRTCDAFPDRIPDEIWVYVNPHTQPISGDHGIQFELDEQRDKEVRLPAHFRRRLRARVGSRSSQARNP